MSWKSWIILLLIGFTAAWMLFDGMRALIVGDYVMPTSGDYAAQLGPWSSLVQGIGIEPRSTLMKSVFVLYGAFSLAALAAYLLGYAWARGALIVMCILGLWYLPLGTVMNLIVLALLLFGRRKFTSSEED